MKKAEVWNNAFSKINSNESAYWLGFVFGGVGLYKRQNNYHISITSHNANNLHNLSNFIKFEGNIRQHRTPVIYLSSSQIYSDLMCYGVPPSKRTLSVNFPKLLDSHKRSFIHGYMDNNSNISIARSIILEISGPKSFLEPIRDFIHQDFNFPEHNRIKKRTENGAFVLTFGDGLVKKMCDKIYNGPIIRHRNANNIIKILNLYGPID